MPHQIFVSYPQEDKTAAEKVCSILEQNGFSCWIAPRDVLPSMTWATSIVRAIKSSRVMVLILSGHANRSGQIPREVSLAIQERVSVVPVRTEDVQPTGDLEYYLPSTQWLDVFPKPLESYSQELVRVIRTLLAEADPPAHPTSPTIAAPAPVLQPPAAPAPAVPAAGPTFSTKDKVAIGLCYLLPYLIPSILVLIFSGRKVMRFHAWQTIFISTVVDVLIAIEATVETEWLSGVVGAFAIVSWVSGIVFLIRNRVVLPIIGPIAEKLSGS